MFFQNALLLAAATVGAVSAAPLQRRAGTVSAPVKQVIKANATAGDLVRSDRARLNFFKGSKTGTAKRAVSSGVENAVVSYLASIGFGTPATSYSLIVDTGSSNTWAKKFKLTSDATDTGDSVSVTYGSGSFSGEEYTDTVTLAEGVVISKQGVGRATSSSGFTGVDGIVGFGPEDLTADTTSSGGEIPTVIQNAKSQGLISAAVLGVYFAPTTTDDNNNGELTYGGIDTTKTTSNVTYTAKTGEYWGISVTSSLGSGSKSGIVDTGTTLVYLPSGWFSTYENAITGASIDSSSGLLKFPQSSLSTVPNITFTVDGTGFTLNNYAQIVPSALYADLGITDSDDSYYSWINDSDESSGATSFILGQKFLERFYAVFNTDSSEVGFATTANSFPTSIA